MYDGGDHTKKKPPIKNINCIPLYYVISLLYLLTVYC